MSRGETKASRKKKFRAGRTVKGKTEAKNQRASRKSDRKVKTHHNTGRGGNTSKETSLKQGKRVWKGENRSQSKEKTVQREQGWEKKGSGEKSKCRHERGAKGGSSTANPKNHIPLARKGKTVRKQQQMRA